jgi:hypothetical protein
MHEISRPHKAGAGKVQLILRKTPLDISPAVAPGAKRLHDPGRQPHRGISQPVGRGLRLRALNPLRVGFLIELLA